MICNRDNPQQSAYIEQFNRTVRYGWLGQHLFESLKAFAMNWLWVGATNYALGGDTPKQHFAKAA